MGNNGNMKKNDRQIMEGDVDLDGINLWDYCGKMINVLLNFTMSLVSTIQV